MTGNNRETERFDTAFRAWARRLPATAADAAARQVKARLGTVERHRAGIGAWAPRLAVACGVVLVVASGVLLWRNGTPPPMPASAVEVPPVLPDNIVIFWLDPETPVYFVVSPVGDDPGGTP